MKRNRKAFTIVELIIVIVVIGILAAILIPNLTKYIEKTRLTADMTSITNINRVLSFDNTYTSVDKQPTMYDAIQIIEKSGYSLDDLQYNKSKKTLCSME